MSRNKNRRRPRELRRRVMLPARMRTAAGWSEARILNISSRGLMVHANFSVVDQNMVELWHRDLSITARVVWRHGPKAGLQAEERIPVEEILGRQSQSLQLSAEPYRGVERRKRPRSHDHSRIKARAFEFASVAIIGATLAAGFFLWVGEAFAAPLAAVRTALGG